MRQDKLTTKFQQALADAQSLTVGHDNQMIEPQHLLLALLQQDDGATSSLLAQAGTNVQALKNALDQAIDRLPKVEGHGGEVQVGRDLVNLLNLTDKEAQKRGDQFIASEMFLLAVCEDKGEAGRLAKQHGLNRKALEQAQRANDFTTLRNLAHSIKGSAGVFNAEGVMAAARRLETLARESDAAGVRRELPELLAQQGKLAGVLRKARKS